MFDMSGQLCITFNGEIYNYQILRRELERKGHVFKTATDTEVLLQAYREWGTACLARLNGMFAFCIYDIPAKRFFLARDRAGKKPLFYRSDSGGFAFASELKALLIDPATSRELDLRSLNFYLCYGYVPGAMCILKGVQKLPQAHAMEYDLETQNLHVWRYWELPEPGLSKESSPENLTDELEGLLMESVKLRLIADVPLGIMLSGGVDSSLVTVMAAKLSSHPVKTFTISFPGCGSYDETQYAYIVAKHCGTDHTELAAESNTYKILGELACQFDEPVADSSMIPTFLISNLLRQNVTVALGGDGGDELFGGYWHYSLVQILDQLYPFFPRRFRSWMAQIAEEYLPIGMKGRNHLVGLRNGLPSGIAHIDMLFGGQSRLRLLSPKLTVRTSVDNAPEAYKAELCLKGKTPLRQATIVDFMTYLVDDILTKVDRSSMLNSLEVRAPWLDHRIIHFAFSRVPDRMKATVKERKILLRLLAKRVLPQELDITRKQGFSLPLKRWFLEGWGDYMNSVLNEADPNLFNKCFIQELFREQHRGNNNIKRLFALTVFTLWQSTYKIKAPASE